jgi:hypothetical protein
MTEPRDERSREEPAGRDAVAPQARGEIRIHPSEASGGGGDSRPADESVRSREEPAGGGAAAPTGASEDPDPPERSEWWRRGFALAGKVGEPGR